ncbi:MAG TPA: hypothetical protein VFZ73_01790 [Gemmatimonadaceae bacterium]
MTKKLPLVLALAAFAVACSDPTMPNRDVTRIASLDVTPVPGYPFPIADGAVELCKTSDVAGDFDFDVTGPAGIDTDPDITIGAGGGTVCVTLWTSTLARSGGNVETITITETTNANLTDIEVLQYLAPGVSYIAAETADSEDETTATATVYINDDMARRVTFTNDAPDPTGCTYTKGWYRNNGSSTVIAVDGRTIAEAQAIFNATPGKPGSVTFGGNNTLLNLYQQLLAALNNLGGDPLGGPDEVDTAIADALAGTGGTGLSITTSLTQTEMSDLIETLSDFNEGTFDGWPHCDD